MKNKGGSWTKVDLADADLVDALFERHYYAKHLKVDRERIAESEEAWIYVNISCGFDGGLNCKHGVLAWDNGKMVAPSFACGLKK